MRQSLLGRLPNSFWKRRGKKSVIGFQMRSLQDQKVVPKVLSPLPWPKREHLRNGISDYSPSMWASEPRGRGIPATWQSSRLWPLQPLPTVNPKETQNAGLQAPDGWGTYQGNNFSEPWLLSLPIRRKGLNFLTWDLVSWIWSSTFLSLQV